MQPTMEHLTCFLPGNLALGAAYGPLTPSKAEAYLQVGCRVSAWLQCAGIPPLPALMFHLHLTDVIVLCAAG